MEISNEYRGAPFWSWNGNLKSDEIIKQIHVMKEMGFGGFFMHSRTGLETEYLGEDWFKLINLAAEEAEKLGMTAWLYDEDRWPSGTAGGEVTKNKQYQLKFFSMYDTTPDEYAVVSQAADFLACFAVRLNEDDAIIDYNQYSGSLSKGYVLKYIKLEPMANNNFYNGYTYADTLNIDATNEFLRVTHDKYKQMCGDKFGKSIIGIFTDEPHRGAILNGFGLDNQNSLSMLPATYKIFDEFNKSCGYDLKSKLIELYYPLATCNANKTMFDYIGVIQQMFIDNFAKPYQDWCKQNKLILTGHVLHEDSLAIQTIFQGSVQRYYEYMDYPGVDILTEENRAYFVAKQVQSVARQLNKPFVLSELYGCTGWQMNFESHRNVGAWQAILGINLRCHHLSWYTMEGESKRDYPASILHQSGWYKEYSYIEDYFARANQILSSGKPVVDVLVINPVESVWMYAKKGWMVNTFSPTGDEVKQLESQYSELFNTLNENMIDFDYGDEDILSRHFSVVNEKGSALLRVGQSEYKTVVVSGCHTIRQTTLDILNKFMAVGGKVVCVGEKPRYINASAVSGILNDINSIKLDEIAASLVQNKFISASGELLGTVRRVDGEYYVVLLNADRDNGKNSSIAFNGNYSVSEIRLEDGTETNLYSLINGFETHFNKGEMRIFKLTDKAIQVECIKQLSIISQTILDKPMTYALSEDNVLVLDMAAFTFSGKSYEMMEILQVDRTIRDSLKLVYRGGDMIQPWYRKKYLQQQSVQSSSLELKYKFFVEDLPKNVSIVLEQSEKYKIKLNGKAVNAADTKRWIDICFDKISLDCKMFVKGENEISLTVDYDEDTNLEAIYLVGDFGVRIDNVTDKTITTLPKTLEIGDVTNQGLPFYSGNISYFTDVSQGKVKVSLGACYGALTKIGDGSSTSKIAFAPYESEVLDLKGQLVIEVVLTRRNTFGPLHLKGVYSGAYGPEHFVNKSCQQEQYSLINQGLLSAPKITLYK